MKEGKTCCFFDFNQKTVRFFNEQDEKCINLKKTLQKEIENKIVKNNVTHFISGMSIGTDILAAQIVLDLKKKYPQITLECAIPFENQAAYWSEANREQYFNIAAACDKETLIQKHYTKKCILKLSYYMLKSADYAIAFWNNASDANIESIKFSKKHEIQITIIDTADISVH